MGQGLSGSSKPIIASTGLPQGTIADSCRSNIRAIRGAGCLGASKSRDTRGVFGATACDVLIHPALDCHANLVVRTNLQVIRLSGRMRSARRTLSGKRGVLVVISCPLWFSSLMDPDSD